MVSHFVAFHKIERYNENMRVFKIVSSLFICFTLVFGNVASTAMFCCVAKSQPMMQMHSKADIPCHTTAEKTDKKIQHTASCISCKHCVSAPVIVCTGLSHDMAFTHSKNPLQIHRLSSVIPETIYSPPKKIS